MSQAYAIADLEAWDERIREQVDAFGLDCRTQEFEICDHEQMLGYMAYSGMPAHYPHWSYGKAFERQKTLYDYGVSGLPYEMVINSDPTLAYLMRGNSLCLQILTIAHVYGHNDFFKRNFTFSHIRAEQTLANFKVQADRVRSYVEDPSIGVDQVENILDAAKALSLHCRRNPAIRKLNPEEQRKRALEAASPRKDPYRAIHKRPEYVAPDLSRVPLEPDEDLLLFVRDHNPYFVDWQKDLLTIIHDEAMYFLPQIETKIMNEGWATFWHREIMNALDLPEDIYLEFLVRHNQVVAAHPGGINPYHVGFKMWERLIRGDIPAEAEGRATLAPIDADARERAFEIREADRDVSFLRRFLDEKMARALGLFEYKRRGEDLVVTSVADEEHWRDVKATLLNNVGSGSIPLIRVIDADYRRSGTLLLRHEHEGRDLQLEYAERTLEHLFTLWSRPVALETVVNGKPQTLTFGPDGFAMKS